MKNISHTERFLLVSIVPHNIAEEDILKSLTETVSLIESYGGAMVDALLQKREVHDKGMYIGAGKIEEAIQLIKEKKIDIVVLNGIIKPGQIYELKTQLAKANREIEVWDKIDLILHIFSAHAATSESKLQIELAAMRHMGPRIYGMGEEMSQQGGGIGTRGIGETNTELMKQHWRKQIKMTEGKLKKLSAERARLIERRKELGLKTISIVGYTNAGKTSLFNRLVRKHKLTQDALFVTLDSTTGKLYLPKLQQEILISDTIGFIQDLPPELIDAFKSTLMESMHADMLLHIIDASDPHFEQNIVVVEDILHSLGVDQKPKIYVFNKMDTAPSEVAITTKKYAKFSPQYTSVKADLGIQNLIDAIDDKLI
jgi:GTP-binding protein HflX